MRGSPSLFNSRPVTSRSGQLTVNSSGFALACGIALIILGSLQSSCIYHFYQVDDRQQEDVQPFPAREIEQPIYFSLFYGPGNQLVLYQATPSSTSKMENYLQAFYNGVQEGLSHGGAFKEAISISKAPDKGFYCSISFKPINTSPLNLVWGALSIMTLTAVPYYDGTFGYSVVYDFYIDGEKKKSYGYIITKKNFYWLLAWPFLSNSWVLDNPLNKSQATNHRKMAIHRTAQLFLLDAHTDGYF